MAPGPEAPSNQASLEDNIHEVGAALAAGMAANRSRGRAIDERAMQLASGDDELQAALFRLVDELAEDQRRVMVMRFADEKSIREIAESIGRSEGAVKQLQFRALENLRKEFTTEGTEKIKSEL